jgi:hypothetical protein
MLFSFLIIFFISIFSFSQRLVNTSEKRKLISKPGIIKSEPNITKRTFSVLPLSFAYIRTQHTSLNQGYLLSQLGLNTPGSTYLVGSFGFKSSNTSSRSESDLRSFSTQLFFYSPHFNNFGLAGSYVSTGTEGSNFNRAGFYYRIIIPSKKVVYVVVPQLFLNQSSTDAGRFFTNWLININNGLFLIDGSMSYTWNTQSTSFGTEPGLSFRLIQNLRGIISYTYAQSKNKTTDVTTTTQANNLGIEFRSTF